MASENSDTLEVVTFFGTFLHDAAIYGNNEILSFLNEHLGRQHEEDEE